MAIMHSGMVSMIMPDRSFELALRWSAVTTVRATAHQAYTQQGNNSRRKQPQTQSLHLRI